MAAYRIAWLRERAFRETKDQDAASAERTQDQDQRYVANVGGDGNGSDGEEATKPGKCNMA